jgi:hypothetical protein
MRISYIEIDGKLEFYLVEEGNNGFRSLFSEDLLVLGPDSKQATVHLVNGDIGKIGKSLFSRILATFLLDSTSNQLVIYDCDIPIFDCAPYFQELPDGYQQRVVCHRIDLREAGSGTFFDTLTQDVLNGCAVVINLPANGTPLLKCLFKQQSFNPLEWFLDKDITLRHWWVGVPGKDGLSVFEKAVEILNIPTIFVENHKEDIAAKWERFNYGERDRIAQALPWQLQSLILPNYYRPDMEYLEESGIGFIQAYKRSKTTGENTGMNKMQGQRLASWMRGVFEKINLVLTVPLAKQTEIMTPDTNEGEAETGGEAIEKSGRRRGANKSTAAVS